MYRAAKPLPETLKKMQERENQEKTEYVKRRDALAAEQAQREARILERAKKYAQELVANEKATLAAISKAEAEHTFYVPAEAKVAFVIRIRGLVGVSPQTKKILRLFRLLQRNNGVFVRLNKATLEMLRRVEPYVAYGYPTAELVRKLIYKRGAANVNGQRLPLTSNTIVSATLNKFGIESVEDLAHEIYTCGPNFTAANRFLWTFKLSTPKGGFRQIGRHYVDGGDYGNRENLIGELVERML